MVEEQKIISNMMVGTATGAGFDHHPYNNLINSSSTNNNNNNPPNHEFFNFDQHNINSVSHNSDLFWKPSSSNSSSSKPPPIITTTTTTGEFCSQLADESSLQRSCVLIPCEANERPSQGLSLSLSSTNPSTIGIQPFELVRPPLNQHHHHSHQGYFGKPMMINMHHDMMTDDDHQFMRKSGFISTAQHHHQISTSTHDDEYYMNIRNSRYLVPAQDLLNEFCNLGTTNQNNHHSTTKAKAAIIRSSTTNQHCHDHNSLNNITSSSSKVSVKPLNTLEFLELQKRKSKLLQMLDEVDRKYHNYCGQMKAVVSSFEAVAGSGAATVYSALASKAMSRHFRCLRDGIVGQIKATKKAMGEKDISAPGATRGETPRLRLLDQTLRQQKAFQQMTMLDTHPWRPQRGLPERSVSVLRAWLFEHFLHPYPSDVDKHILARQTGLSRSQVSNWFINARVRLWKPMVEEMYEEEIKDNDHENINEGVSDRILNAAIDDENTTLIPQMEQKPTVDQLIRRDSDCLSSIINNHHADHHTAKIIDHDIHQSFARVSADPFGAVELDFSAYNHNFGGSDGDGGGDVSLTLGLQQHAGDGGGGDGGGGVDGGVSLYYPRDHMEDCQNSVQYSSLLEGGQGENLPYRSLMGAQLLHDLAG